MLKKGFTLIELLATIVVLGIILTITVPIISSTVNNSRKEAFKDTASGVLNAVKQTYIDYAGSKMRVDMSNGLIYLNDASESTTKLSYNGKMPKNGYVEINTEGEETVIIYEGMYCAYKVTKEDHIQVKEIKSNDECTYSSLINK